MCHTFILLIIKFDAQVNEAICSIVKLKLLCFLQIQMTSVLKGLFDLFQLGQWFWMVQSGICDLCVHHYYKCMVFCMEHSTTEKRIYSIIKANFAAHRRYINFF